MKRIFVTQGATLFLDTANLEKKTVGTMELERRASGSLGRAAPHPAAHPGALGAFPGRPPPAQLQTTKVNRDQRARAEVEGRVLQYVLRAVEEFTQVSKNGTEFLNVSEMKEVVTNVRESLRARKGSLEELVRWKRAVRLLDALFFA